MKPNNQPRSESDNFSVDIPLAGNNLVTILNSNMLRK
jgi:hypothetical protein